MTTLDVAELERLLAEASKGDWWEDLGSEGGFIIYVGDGRVVCERAAWPHNAAESEANARLIAAARTHLPALIERARMAERLAAALEAVDARYRELAEYVQRGGWQHWSADTDPLAQQSGAALSAARSAGLLGTETEGEHG